MVRQRNQETRVPHQFNFHLKWKTLFKAQSGLCQLISSVWVEMRRFGVKGKKPGAWPAWPSEEILHSVSKYGVSIHFVPLALFSRDHYSLRQLRLRKIRKQSDNGAIFFGTSDEKDKQNVDILLLFDHIFPIFFSYSITKFVLNVSKTFGLCSIQTPKRRHQNYFEDLRANFVFFRNVRPFRSWATSIHAVGPSGVQV